MAYFEKHFSVAEAASLTPLVQEAFRRAAEIYERLRSLGVDPEWGFGGEAGGGEGAGDCVEAVMQLQQIVLSLERRGIQVKDMEAGLVDFPHYRDGREVLLCYHAGEDTVRYWHDLEAGFAGRQKL